MRDLGLGADFEQWAPNRAAPDGRAPLANPRAATLRIQTGAGGARVAGCSRRTAGHVASQRRGRPPRAHPA
eukprot:11208657-Lingulodinium_polyedra.AAC.1